MKILWVCPFLPYPPDNGLRIREYNLIRRIAQKHEVSVFSLIQSLDELKYVAELEKSVAQVKVVLPEKKIPGTLDQHRRIQDVFLGIFDKRPVRFYGCASDNAVRELKELYLSAEYDLMIVEALCMTNYTCDLMSLRKCPTILVEHNIETEIQKLVWQTSTDAIVRLRKWLYYKTFNGFELETCAQFDHIVCVSQKDNDYLVQRLLGIADGKITIIPNGVDLSIGDGIQAEPEPDTLIYSGALSYNANYDAVNYFLQEIFPLIQAKKPTVKFYITGSTDNINLDALTQNKAVIFTGYINNIHQKVKSCWVSVVPLRIGGGTRLKILEAIVLGTPVVSTSKGAEGLRITPGNGCIIADHPDEFAQAVLRLLDDPAARRNSTQQGLDEIKEHYDWNLIAIDFESFLHQVDIKWKNEVNL
jgi:glycosyltransferase involved in cell wall biosynthesis